jgi:4-amino-4-deoxy-L-arabinose transferase-like glycosyltransferase
VTQISGSDRDGARALPIAIAGWLAVAALACVLRAPVAALPFERDEGEYAYIAQRWLAGDVPYRDAFDQKPPGAFLFYAAAFAVGGETPAAVRWAAQLATIAALGALVALGTRLFSPEVGVAAALSGLLLSAHPSWLGNAVNTEQVALAPISFGALFALLAAGRQRVGFSLCVGALGGIALLLKPVTAPIVAFEIATAVLLSRRKIAHAVAAALGVAALLVPVALYFAAHGAWSDFLDAVVWNNLAYAGTTALRNYPASFAAEFGPTLKPLGPLYGIALAAPLALLGAARPRACTRRRLAWVAGWLAASLPAIAAGGYFRQHYFVLALPPLALLAGVAQDAIGRIAFGVRPLARGFAPLASLLLVGASVATSWWYFGPARPEARLHRIYGSNPFPEAPALGAWIAAHAAKQEQVFIYGSEPQLLFYADRKSASRYPFVYPLNMPLPAAAARQSEALGELDAAPPRFVVGVFVRTSTLEQPGTPPALKRGLRERIERDYQVAAVVPFAADRSARILEGKPARAMWNERPLWDGATPWAAYVVWERKPAERARSEP